MKQILFILLVFISFNGFSQTPIKSVKIDKLEVMKTDLGNMTWNQAKKACKKLGDGWRLPSIEELKFMFDNRHEIGEFKVEYYWSSSDDDEHYPLSFYFGDGFTHTGSKNDKYFVRAVRDLK
jgi:hypothetical protein